MRLLLSLLLLPITITLVATDDTLIGRVVLTVDGKKVLDVAPNAAIFTYTYTMPPEKGNKTHTVVVTAIDTSGNQTVVTKTFKGSR